MVWGWLRLGPVCWLRLFRVCGGFVGPFRWFGVGFAPPCLAAVSLVRNVDSLGVDFPPFDPRVAVDSFVLNVGLRLVLLLALCVRHWFLVAFCGFVLFFLFRRLVLVDSSR